MGPVDMMHAPADSRIVANPPCGPPPLNPLRASRREGPLRFSVTEKGQAGALCAADSGQRAGLRAPRFISSGEVSALLDFESLLARISVGPLR